MANPSHLGGDVGGTLLGLRPQLHDLTETEELRGLLCISDQGLRFCWRTTSLQIDSFVLFTDREYWG